MVFLIKSNIYWVETEKLYPELRNTCHYERINDVTFPQYDYHYFNSKELKK